MPKSDEKKGIKSEIKPIVQKEHPVLRQKAAEVPVAEITSPQIQEIIADMRAALAEENDGVGLAAPQIGVGLRIFIVAPDVFDIDRKNKRRRKGAAMKDEDTLTTDPESKNQSSPGHQTVYINPEIIRTSKEKEKMDEGCLSVRPMFGHVMRATKVVIRAYDEHGQQFERGGSGLIAQIFQHEVDHLNGVLFIDKATDLKAMINDDAEHEHGDWCDHDHDHGDGHDSNSSNGDALN